MPGFAEKWFEKDRCGLTLSLKMRYTMVYYTVWVYLIHWPIWVIYSKQQIWWACNHPPAWAEMGLNQGSNPIYRNCATPYVVNCYDTCVRLYFVRQFHCASICSIAIPEQIEQVIYSYFTGILLFYRHCYEHPQSLQILTWHVFEKDGGNALLKMLKGNAQTTKRCGTWDHQYISDVSDVPNIFLGCCFDVKIFPERGTSWLKTGTLIFATHVFHFSSYEVSYCTAGIIPIICTNI